jgi:hypothetical protein
MSGVRSGNCALLMIWGNKTRHETGNNRTCMEMGEWVALYTPVSSGTAYWRREGFWGGVFDINGDWEM